MIGTTSDSIKQHKGVVEFGGGLFVCPPHADYEQLTKRHIDGNDVVVYAALVSRYKFVDHHGEGKHVIPCTPPKIENGQRSLTSGECVGHGGDSLKNGFQSYIFATRANLGWLVRPPFPDAAACIAEMTADGGDPNTWFWVFAPYARGEGTPGEALHFRADTFAFALRTSFVSP